MKWHIVVATALLCSCSKDGCRESASSCRTEAQRFREWVTTLRAEGGHAWPNSEKPFGADLVVTSAGNLQPEHSVLVRLSADELFINGEPVSAGPVEPKRFAKLLGAFFTAYEKSMPDSASDRPLGLLVDRATPWSRVVQAVRASARAGHRDLQLLFEGRLEERTLSRPPASSFARQIAAAREKTEELMTPIHPAEKQEPLGKIEKARKPSLLARAAAGCSQLKEIFESQPDAPPSERATRLTDDAADALEACGCKADVAAIKEIYWYFVFPRPRSGPPRGVRFTAAEPGAKDAMVVEAPADATWEEAHRKILERTRTEEAPALLLRSQ